MSPHGFSPPVPRSLASRTTRRRSPISLTPLIDVVFILLVFFMLASSFFDWRSITLDAPSRTGAGTPMEGTMLVELRGDGIRLSGEVLSLDRLVARVSARLVQHPDQRVLVKPSPGVPLQDAIAVLDRLAASGVRGLSLIRDDAPGQE